MATKTLSQMIRQIDQDLKRGGSEDDNIKRALQYAVMYLRGKNLHYTERRHARLKLVAGQAWYATFADEQPADEDQQDDLSEIQHSFDEPAYGGTVDNAVSLMEEAWHIDTAGVMSSVRRCSITDFNQMRAAPVSHTIPTHYCSYAGNIGLYPTPSTSDEWVMFHGRFYPYYPTSNAHTCIFFDKCEHLVIAIARYWLSTFVFRDGMDSDKMRGEINELINLAKVEGSHQNATGRLRPSI